MHMEMRGRGERESRFPYSAESPGTLSNTYIPKPPISIEQVSENINSVGSTVPGSLGGCSPLQGLGVVGQCGGVI